MPIHQNIYFSEPIIYHLSVYHPAIYLSINVDHISHTGGNVGWFYVLAIVNSTQ